MGNTLTDFCTTELLGSNYSLAAIDRNMQAYTSFVLYTQNQDDPFGLDIRVEPKFSLPYGEVYDQPWGRPYQFQLLI